MHKKSKIKVQIFILVTETYTNILFLKKKLKNLRNLTFADIRKISALSCL